MQNTSSSAGQPLLSVVVPVYNVAQYFDQCLASVFDQGFAPGELEVIVVDDGSTDGSGLIADKWARRHAELQSVRQPNSGLSAARNTGLDLATGTFLTFLDSDDIIPSGAYRRMIDVLRQTGSDFITAAPFRFAGWDRHAKPFARSADLYHESRRAVTLEQHPEYLRDFAAWNKIYRREFFVESEVRFPEGRIYEEIATSPILYSKAKAFDVFAEAGYFWRMTPGSITQTIKPVKAHDRLAALAHIQHYFKERGSSPRLQDELGFAIVDYNLRWTFLEYFQLDEETQRYIAEKSREVLASVPDETITRVQSPLSDWAMLAKRGDAAGLDSALRTSQHENLPDIPPGSTAAVQSQSLPRQSLRDRIRDSRRLPDSARRLRNFFVYLALRPVLFRMPLLENTAVFSNYWGQKFSLSDGPAAVCIELNRSNPSMRSIVFATRNDQRRIRARVRELAADPRRIKVVRNTSFAYYWYIWRAKYLFNDANFQLAFRVDKFTGKRPGQIEVQTTHGIPIKKMGIDSEAAIDLAERKVFLARSQRCDYLVSTSPLVAETYAHSFGIEPRVLQAGLPQHDVLFTPPDAQELLRIRKKYGLDPQKRIAVYAPTFRNADGSVFPCLLDLHMMQDQLGDEYQLVMKVHPFNHTQLGLIDFRELTDFAQDPVPSPFVKLMGEVRLDPSYVAATLDYEASRSRDTVRKVDGSINELMFVADVVISDYSSLMFGYTHLRKPLVLFTPDIDHYNATRGSYYNVDEIAPGAVTKTTEQVIEAIRLSSDADSWNERFDVKRNVFTERFLEWDRGDASRKVLAALGLMTGTESE
ncbi:glycosyltransferase [Leucobacter coleopterorum]|uniref:Glycosyltransferase n=1 Tax=Leucobacter coleopterorum TaxID=2714933 RepID=A0ABX6JYA0_9MICO|nr:CDP-glycerol glycerophosphotransferase family protein [Leucobacter coleopterorum]QIM19300.1 glycosyltransferase [Leucobacter coleopterorum]